MAAKDTWRLRPERAKERQCSRGACHASTVPAEPLTGLDCSANQDVHPRDVKFDRVFKFSESSNLPGERSWDPLDILEPGDCDDDEPCPQIAGACIQLPGNCRMLLTTNNRTSAFQTSAVRPEAFRWSETFLDSDSRFAAAGSASELHPQPSSKTLVCVPCTGAVSRTKARAPSVAEMLPSWHAKAKRVAERRPRSFRPLEHAHGRKCRGQTSPSLMSGLDQGFTTKQRRGLLLASESPRTVSKSR